MLHVCDISVMRDKQLLGIKILKTDGATIYHTVSPRPSHLSKNKTKKHIVFWFTYRSIIITQDVK